MHAWPINDTASQLFPLYSRANVGEVFPDPTTPLNASTGFFANLEPGWRDAFVATGVWGHELYDDSVPSNPIACFSGYLYLNMSLMRLFGVRMPGFTPEAVDLQYFGDMPGIPPYEVEKRDFDENPAQSEVAGAFLMSEVLGVKDLAVFDALRARAVQIKKERPVLDDLSDQDLADRLRAFNVDLRHMFEKHIVASLAAGVGLGGVAAVCQAIGQPELSLTLVAGLGDVDSAAPSLGMWRLSRTVAGSPTLTAAFDAGASGLLDRLRALPDRGSKEFVVDLESFLDEWDFRGPNEWELRAPVWGTKPELVLGTIDRLRGVDDREAPEAKGLQRAHEREAASALVRTVLADDDAALAQFEAALHAAALWQRARERQRATCAMVMHEQRLAANALGRRAAARGDLATTEEIFMLFADELDDWLKDPAALASTLAERERVYLDLFAYEPPFVVTGQPDAYTHWARRDAKTSTTLRPGETIAGVSGCPGVVQGRARVVLTPDEASELEPDDILIAPITDPSWTPLFMSAAGVVVNVGAPFSHAAIVSRELGIPCVVSALDATTRIPDRALLEVNGTTGLITVLER